MPVTRMEGSDGPATSRLRRSFPAALVMAVVVCGGNAAATNIIVNPGFETGTGVDADGWTEIEVAGGTMGASALADRQMVDPNSGDYSMSFSLVGASDFGPVAEIQQQTSVGSVTPGLAYDFSFWSKGAGGPGAVGFYEVSWFDGDGSNGGGIQGSATGLQTYAFGGAYTENAQNNLIAPAGADSVFVQIRLVTGAFDGASGDARIDDVSFAQVPEVSTALLGLGGALLLLCRRARH